MSSANKSLAARIATIKPVPASVQLLEKQLIAGEQYVRDSGLTSIAKVKPPTEPLTDLLARLIEHENWFVRRSSAAALTRCAELDDAAQIAIHNVAASRLEHQDQDVRKTAARALIAIVKASNEEPLPVTSGLGVKTIKQPGKMKEKPRGSGDEAELSTSAPAEDDDARSEASDDSMFGCAAPGSIGKAPGMLALEEISERLGDPKPEVRRLAIDSLNTLGYIAEPFAKRLGQALADVDVGVRNAALESFRVLGSYCNGGIEEVAKLLRSENEVVRHQARKAMHIVKDYEGKLMAEAVANQLAMLEQQKKSAREKAKKKNTAEQAQQDLALARTCTRFVLTCLCELGPLIAPHAKVIIEYLAESDVELRAAAVRALISGGADVANSLKLIRKKMDHHDPDAQRAAVDVLRGLAPLNPTVAASMGKLLQEDSSDSSPDVIKLRKQVLQILGASGKNAKRFLNDIAKELEAPDFQCRRAALEAFVELGTHAKSAGLEIARRLLHADPVVRRITVETIGRMGNVCADYFGRVESLAETEEDEDVKFAIKRTLGMAPSRGMQKEGAPKVEHKRRNSIGKRSPTSPGSMSPAMSPKERKGKSAWAKD